MVKQRGALLGTTAQTRYQLHFELQKGETATFIYSNRQMAREHLAQLTAYGVIGGLAIKNSTFSEVDEDRKKV